MLPSEDMRAFAQVVVANLRQHFPYVNMLDMQTLALQEECGELIGAYRRWAGMARRSGTETEMLSELADVRISMWVYSELCHLTATANDSYYESDYLYCNPSEYLRQLMYEASEKGLDSYSMWRVLTVTTSFLHSLPKNGDESTWEQRADKATQAKMELIISRGWGGISEPDLSDTGMLSQDGQD